MWENLYGIADLLEQSYTPKKEKGQGLAKLFPISTFPLYAKPLPFKVIDTGLFLDDMPPSGRVGR